MLWPSREPHAGDQGNGERREPAERARRRAPVLRDQPLCTEVQKRYVSRHTATYDRSVVLREPPARMVRAPRRESQHACATDESDGREHREYQHLETHAERKHGGAGDDIDDAERAISRPREARDVALIANRAPCSPGGRAGDQDEIQEERAKHELLAPERRGRQRQGRDDDSHHRQQIPPPDASMRDGALAHRRGEPEQYERRASCGHVCVAKQIEDAHGSSLRGTGAQIGPQNRPAQVPKVSRWGCRKSGPLFRGLLPASIAVHAGCMETRPGRRPLSVSPLQIAAYITWLAIAVELMRVRTLVDLGPLSGRIAAGALMLLFLGGFQLSALPRTEPPPARASTGILLMIAAAFSILLLGPTNTTAVLLIIIASMLAFHYEPRTVVIALLAMNCALLVVFALSWRVRDPIRVVLLMAGFQMFAAITAYSSRRATSAAESLRAVNADLLATRSLLAEGARASERLRLSRELHDVSGHKLTALKLNLNALARDPQLAGRKEVISARTLATELLDEIRAVVTQLRQHEGVDVRDALQALAQSWPSPEVHVTIDEAARIEDVACADVIVRLAQEALTNAARHAGARNVWLTLARRPDSWSLTIEDDGRGAQDLQPGTGLMGMRERLAELSGSLEIAGGSAGGLKLTALIPRPAQP
jgi:signal transduction histidine kinase